MARIPGRTPTEIRFSDGTDNIEFEYEHPLISIDSSARTAEHSLLIPDSVDQLVDRSAREPVVQFLGPEVTKITMRGHCYIDEANQVDDLTRGQRVRLVSERRNTRAIVNTASTDPRGSGGGPRQSIEERIYDYNIELSESIEAYVPPESRNSLAAFDDQFEQQSSDEINNTFDQIESGELTEEEAFEQLFGGN